MPKPATGFVTEDGTFFADPQEAELYEAEVELRQACNEYETSKNTSVDDDKLIVIVVAMHKQIRRYINAYVSFSTTVEQESTSKPASVQQQPTGSDEPMSDVGGGERKETVLSTQPSTSPRGRRNDASGVRRRSHLATGRDTEGEDVS